MKRLVFVVGGQMGDQWTDEVQIYDIEKGKFVRDQKLTVCDLPESLQAPSMSGDLFGTLGLIVCG